MRFTAYDSQKDTRRECYRFVVASLPTGTAAQSATGVPEGTYKCTAIKNGTGDYTLNFNTAFARKPIVTITALHATAKLFCVMVSRSTTSVRFSVYSDAGTATDATEVDIYVEGFDTADQVG